MKDSLPSELTRIALKLYESLGSPIALEMARAIKDKDWERIARVTVDPRTYACASDYLRDQAAACFLKKYKQLPASIDRREATLKKWYQGEFDCKRSNIRLTPFLPAAFGYGVSPQPTNDREKRILEFFQAVKRQIGEWIGHGPPIDLIGRMARHGPGATFSDRGRHTTVPDKMTSVPTLTHGINTRNWLLAQWLVTAWGRHTLAHHGKCSYVPGNRYSTVDKTLLIDRAIAAEPSINIFFQLGAGKVLRDRLKRHTGWDLDTASEIHQRIAAVSSRSREFATLDLSNASDTVSKNLVRVLLPHKWARFLEDLRSPKTFLKPRGQKEGKWVVLEKHSSMGNGYTFELETIIFAALSCVAVREGGHIGQLGKDVFVFGDDIIIPDDAVGLVRPVLEFCGFTLNMEKSFWGRDCPFRESCGADYFNGLSVRGYYLKDEPNAPQDFIALANGLKALGERLLETGDDFPRAAWLATLDCIPTRIRRLRGPVGLGDVVIHDDVSRWTVKREGWCKHILCFVPKPVYKNRKKRIFRGSHIGWGHFRPEVVLASALLGVGSGQHGVMPRDPLLEHSVEWVQWCDVGS